MNFQQNFVVNIYDILNCMEENKICDNCNQSIKLKRQFINCPPYLIIIIHHKEVNVFKFNIQEKIDIKQYINNKINNTTQYELVSFIQDVLVTYCKSEVDKRWYKYDSKKENKLEEYINLKKMKEISVPYLLIYRNKDFKEEVYKKLQNKNNNKK